MHFIVFFPFKQHRFYRTNIKDRASKNKWMCRNRVPSKVSSQVFYYVIKIALCFENWKLISLTFNARLFCISRHARKDKQ